MQNTLILTLVVLAISTSIGLAQDDRTQFKSIDEVLTASRKLKPKAAAALIKSVDVVAIAKTLMDAGKAHYLGDARFAVDSERAAVGAFPFLSGQDDRLHRGARLEPLLCAGVCWIWHVSHHIFCNAKQPFTRRRCHDGVRVCTSTHQPRSRNSFAKGELVYLSLGRFFRRVRMCQ